MIEEKRPIWLLLVEDSLACANQISRYVLNAIPELRLAHARSLEEAQILACELPVSLFLVDVCLPDGDGIDFLCDMATVQPDAHAFVMSGQMREADRERAEALAVARFFEKPVDLQELVRMVREIFGLKLREAFHASLGQLTPVDIVQLKCISLATCGIEFSTDDEKGRIYFTQGAITHAELGSASGLAAFNEIVNWKHGNAREFHEDGPQSRTIVGNWQLLLLNAVKHQDDKAVAGA